MNYIIDFMCKELLLLIEVDGISHQFTEIYQKDVDRQVELEEVGFTVLRFSTDDVLNRTKDVIGQIERQYQLLLDAQV